MFPTAVTTIAEFQTHHREHAARLRETGGAELLVCDGEAECVVVSPETYDRLIRAEEHQESVRMGRIALAQLEAGQGRPLSEFVAECETRYGIKVSR